MLILAPLVYRRRREKVPAAHRDEVPVRRLADKLFALYLAFLIFGLQGIQRGLLDNRDWVYRIFKERVAYTRMILYATVFLLQLGSAHEK